MMHHGILIFKVDNSTLRVIRCWMKVYQQQEYMSCVCRNDECRGLIRTLFYDLKNLIKIFVSKCLYYTFLGLNFPSLSTHTYLIHKTMTT